MTRIIYGLAVLFFLWCVSNAKTTARTPNPGKSIPCDERMPMVVRVQPGRVTVLNFPFKPRDVVPGSSAFDFKQIKNDLVIMAITANAHTNAVVYLGERKCVFDLIGVKSRGDDILIVKDPKDSQYEVKFQ